VFNIENFKMNSEFPVNLKFNFLGILAIFLDAIEHMITYIEANAPKISKTPFKMEKLLQNVFVLLINFVTQNKK